MNACKKLISLLLALSMVFSLVACGAQSSTTETTQAATTAATEPAQSGSDGDITPEELGSGDVKWSEERTSDGYYLVTNQGGTTLGYATTSGISLIQVDGYAFKDLNKDGLLNPYEDWRNSAEVRAADLAARMDIDSMTGLFTHGGWSVSTTVDETSSDWDYIVHGGRGGVTRGSIGEGTTTTAVTWNNALQAACESLDYGIPALISVDPDHISGTLDNISVSTTFDTEFAFELGKMHGEMYRAVGITMLLGPQVDICSTPLFQRTSGAYADDPALTRDIVKAYVSGLQSTWAEDGTDLGWGEDSVYAIVKHFAGAGAGEGGRNDHYANGKYDVFPADNFEAHLIAYFDGAFDLDSITGSSGIMTNYAISYSRDGSLGDLVAGAYSHYKTDLLKAGGFDGFIITDWGIVGEGEKCWGVEDYTDAEQWALLMQNGINQVGGSADYATAREGYDVLCDWEGEEAAEALLRNTTTGTLKLYFNLGLFDNAYVSLSHAQETVYTAETDAIALSQQEKAIVMLKNSDGFVKEATDSDTKLTAYVPYIFTPASEGNSSAAGSPASWGPAMDLESVAKYYNVVTDSVGEPTGEPDADGNPTYTENDVIRASAADLAKCDVALVPMSDPFTGSDQDEEGNYLPGSLQFEAYTADTARRESLAGDVTSEIINDGYGTKTQVSQENRSYYGNSVGQASNYNEYEMLQYVASAVPASCTVAVMVNADNAMIWSEVEPLADVILYYFGAAFMTGSWFQDEAILNVLSGQAEPYGLLTIQQPASMEAVEAQLEDVPRDCECYVDSEGNTYDFAYGMNWSGVINDERVQKYAVEPLTECENFDFFYAN